MQGKSVHNGVIFAFLILFMPVNKIGLNMRKRSYLVKSLVSLIMIDRMNTDREIHPLEGYEFINLIGNIPVQCRLFFFPSLCLRCIWAIRYKRLSITWVMRLHFNIQNKRKHDHTTLMLAITFIPTNSQNNGRFREINHFASIGRSIGCSADTVMNLNSTNRFTNKFYGIPFDEKFHGHDSFDRSLNRNEKEMEANGKSENILGWQLEMAGYRRWSQHKSYKKKLHGISKLFIFVFKLKVHSRQRRRHILINACALAHSPFILSFHWCGNLLKFLWKCIGNILFL